MLKFNSESKSGHKKKTKTISKTGSSSKGSKGFKFKSNTSDKLMDLNIEGQVLGRGIFQTGFENGIVRTESSHSN